MATSVTMANDASEVTPAITNRAVEDKVVELRGPDGSVTRIVERPDGTIEIHTAAMEQSRQAVCVPTAGSAQPIRF